MPHDFLADSLILAFAASAAGAVIVRFRLSPIMGYLAAGVVVGPTGLDMLSDTDGIRLLGEFGVTLLMFVVGLEFSWPRMVAARGVVFGLGSLQVGSMALAGTVVGMLAGAAMLPSMLIGFAAAMSSTAIVHKQLLDQDEATSHHGVLATGFLLFQDFVALSLLALVGALDERAAPDAVRTIARLAMAIALFLAVALLARRTLGRLLEWAARSGSNEFFLLSTLLLILGTAFAAERLHLSLPVGAFIVGMMAGETDFRHQLQEEIRPFRDLLLGLFFLTIGMAVDLTTVAKAPLITAALLAMLVGGKFAVVFALARLSHADTVSAVRTAVLLAHGGEFALLIVSQALRTGLLPGAYGQPVLTAMALSMFFAPALVQWNGHIAALFAGRTTLEAPHLADEARMMEGSKCLRHHVILAGCGPVGRLVATALESAGVAYVAIERDTDRLRKARSQGHHILFGDAARPGILKAAGLNRAAVVVALLNDRRRLEQLVRQVRQLNAGIPILVSTRDDSALEPIMQAGATRIFPENLAAGLALAMQTLLMLGIPAQDADAKIHALRTELNPELGTFYLR
ncbi:sodium:proton exchanger [Sphingomonas oleivorans]|uniref:Sodium:proton exchanger n=1 Tax=Sphingomonas oleivorans TaxID=1735121 RepID=A0A2T5FZQ7_9SPHN|nr:cation:proton antiporter [Sphingomonas oleivorans]PTQ12193.1 sodium:proton exchanger [Sphingomonas oleivorans]